MEAILDTEVGRSKADRLGSAMCGHRTGKIVGNTPGEEVYLVIQQPLTSCTRLDYVLDTV